MPFVRSFSPAMRSRVQLAYTLGFAVGSRKPEAGISDIVGPSVLKDSNRFTHIVLLQAAVHRREMQCYGVTVLTQDSVL